MPWGSQLWLLLGLVGWWTCPHLLTSGAFVGIPPTTRCASSNLQKPTNLPNLLFLFSRWSSASSGHPEGGFSWASSNRYIPIQRSLRALGSYVNNCSLKQHLRCPSRLPGIPDCARATAGHSLWDECTIPLLTQVDRFVLFGDLHVSEATLPTCLDALSLVQQACKRQSTSDSAGYQKKPTAVAGRGKEGNSESQKTPAVAVFLGDFWHSRIERHLHWGLLRPVLEFWEQWDVPVVLLPGNHDQLSYEAGRDLLQPLEKAVSRSPLVLPLRRPTLINQELLFLPHIRELGKLRRIMSHAKQCKTLRAVFGHLSVRGATLNPLLESDWAILNDGIDIDLLPDVPVYSGHIHTPQLVGKQVRYVGSLYQTSLAEAYQRKCLYTISRSCDFEVVDVQESTVGPRHFPVRDPRLLPPPQALRRGDRVVLLPSTSATAELPASQSVVQPHSHEGSGGQLPPQRELDSNAESLQRQSEDFADQERSMLNTSSGSDHASSSWTVSPKATLGGSSGLDTALNESLMRGKNELNTDQLLQICDAYREAGVLFDCRVNPLASASSVSQHVTASVGNDHQETPSPINVGLRGLGNPSGANLQNISTHNSRAAEEQSAKDASQVSTDFDNLLPDASTSPLRLLIHHGLIPVENRPPREALRVYADQLAKDGSHTFSEQALEEADMILKEQVEGACWSGAESSCRAASLPTGPNAGWPHAAADLVIHQARVQSYGLYSGVVVFDLRRRGMVFIQGSKDPHARGSLHAANGAGKTTMMQAVVWALIGDAVCNGFTAVSGRPKVTGVVCDDVPPVSTSNCGPAGSFACDERGAEDVIQCAEDRFASVELEGELNGEPFCLRRIRWRSGRCELTLHVGGRDMTAQSVVDTQRELESLFGGRLKAWSQFIYLSSQGADGLLRTSEANFSALLSLLFPLDIWTAATAAARVKQRVLSKAAEALDHVAAIRLRDLQRLVGRRTRFLPTHHTKTGLTVNVRECEGTDIEAEAKQSRLDVNSSDDHSVLSHSLGGVPLGDGKGATRIQARRLQRLISLLRSRAAFYISQKAVLEEVELHLGPQGIQRHLLASALCQLEEQTNIYLKQASDGLLRLDFASSKTSRLTRVLSVRGSDGAFRQAEAIAWDQNTNRSITSSQRRAGLRCNVLFLDEPFLSLDSANKQRVLELLRSLASEPRSSQLAEFDSIFFTQHGLDPRKWRRILDAVDTIAIHKKSGHPSIRTSIYLKSSKTKITGTEAPSEHTADVKIGSPGATDHESMAAAG